MIVKQLFFEDDARKKLISGIEKLSKAVGSTMGARGRTVLIESENVIGGVTISKDGVTVAKSINLYDPLENLAVRLVREAAEKTVLAAGDGPQPLNSNVLTPSGWVKIKELKVGDLVCGTNETTQTVMGVFPKGIMETYEVVFGDGRTVECSSNHLWTVTTCNGTLKTITTNDMVKDFKRVKGSRIRYKYFVETSPVDFYENKSKHLDPYLVGLLLGDGSLSGTGSIELSLGINKKHVIDRIVLPEGITMNSSFCEGKNYYRVKLNGKTTDGLTMFDLVHSIGLLGVRSDDKFIPKKYLYSSLHDRVQLLQGLIDTDGHVNKRGLFEFSTVSSKLADDFQELISSLNFSFNRVLHTRDNDKGSYSSKSIHRITQLKGYKYGAKIVDIKPTGVYTEMMCIKVSNENHLYITDGYIPTHNTTTAVVLTEALIKSAIKEIGPDGNVVEITREMQRIKDLLIDNLSDMSQKVSGQTLVDVATISANNDKGIGKLIASTYKAVGKNGIVTVENSNNHETYADVIKGMRIDRGFTSNYFINDQKNQQCVLDNPYVLITDSEITNLMSIQHIFAKAIETKRPLLIIAELSQASMATLNMNVAKGIIKACHIVPPNFGHKKQTIMSDLAVALGGTYFSESTGDDLQLITPDDLGTAEKIIVTQDTTTIIGKRNDAVKNLLAELNENLKAESRKTEVKFLRERISSLSGSVGVIYVGADSDIEQKEKRDRVDDAVLAVAAAMEQGILPGGGTALLRACALLKDEDPSSSTVTALSIMKNAMRAPFEKINSNAGLTLTDGDYITCSDGSTGIDVRTGDLCNMVGCGIIDAAKVTKSALSNAVSVATTILMTDAAITNVRE